MTSKSPVRSCDDVDEQALSYAEIKALCAGNPLIREKMDLDVDVAKLKVLRADYQSKHFRLEDQLLKYFPAEIEAQQSRNRGFETDVQTAEAHPLPGEGFVGMEVGSKHYAEKADAGDAILALCKEIKSTEGIPIGSYRGFQMELSYDTFEKQFQITQKGNMSYRVSLGTDSRGNLTRLDNALAGIPGRLERGGSSWKICGTSKPPHRWNWQSRFRRRRSLPKRARGLRNWTPPSTWRNASHRMGRKSARRLAKMSVPLFWRI